MNSNDSDADLELIAALIDGKLSGPERERAVALLANSDEGLEVFASTLRQQPGAPATNVISIAAAPRWRQWRVVLPAAAAAVLVVVLVPRIGGRRSAEIGNNYAVELTRSATFAGKLPAGWEERGWARTRGSDSSQGTLPVQRANKVQQSKLAFRLGVRSVDLQVALRGSDTAVARRLANEIDQTLSGVEFSESVRASYAALAPAVAADDPPRLIDRARTAERQLGEFLDSPSFAFGQWAGAVELATKTRDASFIKTNSPARFIQSANDLGLGPQDVEALRTIDSRLNQELDDRALDDVHTEIQAIIVRMSR